MGTAMPIVELGVLTSQYCVFLTVVEVLSFQLLFSSQDLVS